MPRPRVLPGLGPTLGGALLYLSLTTLIPLGALVFKTFDLTTAEIWEYLTDPRAVVTYRVTLISAGAATLVNLVLGLGTAWILVRYDFPGRRALDAAIDLPFALPTAVAGLALSALTVPDGWVGQFFAPFGIKIAYAFPGIILAMAFTSFPFVVRTVQPVLEEMEPALEEAAASLGASSSTTFWRVILPELKPALFSGLTLSFIRSIGEFGAVVFIAGNLPFKTEITSLLIYIRVGEFDYPGAAVLATLILTFALLLLVTMNIVQARLYRRLHP